LSPRACAPATMAGLRRCPSSAPVATRSKVRTPSPHPEVEDPLAGLRGQKFDHRATERGHERRVLPVDLGVPGTHVRSMVADGLSGIGRLDSRGVAAAGVSILTMLSSVSMLSTKQ
jgi:hypothetical protein